MRGAAKSEVDDDTLLARAYLSRVAEPASLALWTFVDRLGPIESARLIRIGQVPEVIAGLTAARRDRAEPGVDLDAAEHHGIRLVVPESADWPHLAVGALERVARSRLPLARPVTAADRYGGEPAPPLALWVKGGGDLASLGLRSAALVGSRAASPYGEHVASLFGYGLAGRAISMVSGGAYGIDAAAHRATLRGDGETIIVSAGGIDRPYPAGNASLYEQAADRGLIIGESPPGSAPQRHRFLSRNRLIAAFATGTVVVEAARRSGALNTASHAVMLGRPLMVVPGPVTSAMSVGCHDLLRNEAYGALLVTSVAEVAAIVAGISEAADSGEGLDRVSTADAKAARAAARTDALDRLDAVTRRVFDGLAARGWRSEQQVSVRAGVTVPDVLRALPALRTAGLIESGEQGHRIAALSTPPM